MLAVRREQIPTALNFCYTGSDRERKQYEHTAKRSYWVRALVIPFPVLRREGCVFRAPLLHPPSKDTRLYPIRDRPLCAVLY